VTYVGTLSLFATPPTTVRVRGLAEPRSAVADDLSIGLDFDSYYRNDYRSLVGLAIVLTGSRNVAEDLCQEALTEAHRRWDDVQHFDDPGAWVRRVLVNKSRSRFRRVTSEAKAMARLGGRRQQPALQVGTDDAAGDVWAAIRRLPERQAQAVALFYWEDRSIAQIATILACGEETVKTHLKRGRAALAESLDAHDPRTTDTPSATERGDIS